jgi:eukaryotic-like serine/threonine-protein kinase
MPLLEESPEQQPAPSPSRLVWLWPAAAALCFLAAAALALLHFREKPAAAPEQVRFQIPVGVAARSVEFQISPDGRKLAFIVQAPDGIARVWVHSLDSVEAHPLPGTESPAYLPIFWSPDSRYIGFATGAKLMKIDAAGGPAQTICDVLDGGAVGGSWNRDGTIIFGTNAGRHSLMRVSPDGGTASPVTRVEASRNEIQHDHPSFLPDGRHFIYTRLSRTPENSGIYVGSLDAKPEEQSLKRLVATESSAEYVPSRDGADGFLLFLREGTVMEQPFDSRRLELAGAPITVAEQVGVYVDKSFFSASASGVLVYRNGEGPLNRRLTWEDRRGNILATIGEPAVYIDAALSPDGKRAVTWQTIADAGGVSNLLNRDLWILDFARGAESRFTFGPLRNESPVWSPDGSRIVFASNRMGELDLYQKPADGSKDEELVLRSAENKTPTSWSHDGRFLMYTVRDPKTKNDLWVLPDPEAPGSAQAKPFLRTEANETEGAFSPDGHWVAYVSDESSRREIYVRGFPSGGKWLVSQGGGAKPQWRNDGKELFYFAPDGTGMSVDVTVGAVFQSGAPKPLFRLPSGATALAVSGDGQRTLVAVPAGEQSTQPPFNVILNWQAGLKK